MDNLISANEASNRYVLHYKAVQTAIEQAGLVPKYSHGQGRGALRLYDQAEVATAVVAYKKAREAKQEAAREAKQEVARAPAAGLDLSNELENVQAFLDQVREAVEHSDQRCQQAQRAAFAAAEKRFDKLDEQDHQDDAWRKRVFADIAVANTKLDRCEDHQNNLITATIAHTGRLDRLQQDVDGIKATLEAVSAAVGQLLARNPLPVQPIGPITGGPEFVTPTTRTVADPTPVKCKPRRALVLGLLPNQVQAVKRGIGDAWDLVFFGGSKAYDQQAVRNSAVTAEIILTLNSFGGKGPEALAKDTGTLLARCAGTSGIVDELISRL